jgi:hypothetical protein
MSCLPAAGRLNLAVAASAFADDMPPFPSLIHLSTLGMPARPFIFPVGRSRCAAVFVSLSWSFLLVLPVAVLSLHRRPCTVLTPSPAASPR